MDLYTVQTGDATQQTVTITINGSTDAPPLQAVNDTGEYVRPINLVILGSDDDRLVETGNQLNGAAEDRFNFNVSLVNLTTAPAWTAPQWDALFNSADVVLLGGYDPANLGYFNAPTGLQQLVAYYQGGGDIVTTGLIHEHLIGATGATLTAVDTITPLDIPGGAPQLYTSGTEVVISTSHPVTANVDDFTLSTSLWTGTSTGSIDADADQLATFSSGSNFNTVVVKEASGAGEGNLAFVGGQYLNNNLTSNPLELRSGDPDFLLEQALAWAAGTNQEDETENSQFTIFASDLLANDVSAETANIIGVSAVSTRGATLTGGNINYNALTSPELEALNDANPAVSDSFIYTVTDGVTTETATVTFDVRGITDGDDLPELPVSFEMNGFGSGSSNFYRFGNNFSDADEATGVTYVLHNGTNEITAPVGMVFDPTFVTFTFDGTSTPSSYTSGLGLYAYEADGQAVYTEISYALDADRDLVFFYSGFDAADGGPVLEMAFDDTGVPDGIDLSGIDLLAPGLLEDVAVLDLRNGQGNQLSIDNADLLAILVGGPFTNTRELTIQADGSDVIQSASSGTGWTANLNDDTTGGNDSIDFISDGSVSDYGGGGNIFATLTIDGAEGIVL
jgi:hypothetical protein